MHQSRIDDNAPVSVVVERDWIINIDRHVNVDARKALVGNKSDMGAERAVSTEEGQRLADG